MVDPFDVTDYGRSPRDLQEYWLFCLAVAGKKATMIASKVAEFLSPMRPEETPLAFIRRLDSAGMLEASLREVRMGKYGLLAKAFRASSDPLAPSLRTATAVELETIPGVGPKTARFFILHSRRDADVAVIDTHVLKYLAAIGHRVPKGVPTGKAYAHLESLMLEAARSAGVGMAEFDLGIWSHYASGGRSPLPSIAAGAEAHA